MATRFYSCSLIPARPTSGSVLNKYSLLPNPRISITRRHTTLVSSSSSSSSFTLRASVSSAATSTAVDGTISSTKPSKSLPFRVGHGFDLHRLEPGYPLIIGGIDIPHDRGCEAHSDGIFLIPYTFGWFKFINIFPIFISNLYFYLKFPQFCIWD
uniref:2-C-methyl-D-erythritol 2,4-cyclodiphosphate synthase domain-containing protein n=1 Tax=Gossypium raimondii TaxID=29730 RepID=A0A0D2ML61_GOSRA|nr:hypothetical protein B456_003G085800 [Gossypium raimondii]